MNRKDASINLKVRLIEEPDCKGTIISLSSRKSKEHIIIEWENGNIDPVEPKEIEVAPSSDGFLEKEFEALADTIGTEIQSMLQEAEKLLKKACSLADAYGLPFWTNVSLLGQPYIPENFKIKWNKLDRDFVTNLTEVATADLGSAYGWRHSMAC